MPPYPHALAAVLLVAVAGPLSAEASLCHLFEGMDGNRFTRGLDLELDSSGLDAKDFPVQNIPFDKTLSSMSIEGGTLEIFRDGQFGGFMNSFFAAEGFGFEIINLQPENNDASSSVIWIPYGFSRRRRSRRSLLDDDGGDPRLNVDSHAPRQGEERGGGPLSPPSSPRCSWDNCGVWCGGRPRPPPCGPAGYAITTRPTPTMSPDYYSTTPAPTKPTPSQDGFYGSFPADVPQLVLYEDKPRDFNSTARGASYQFGDWFDGDFDGLGASSMILCSSSVVGYLRKLSSGRPRRKMFEVRAAPGTCVDVTFDENTAGQKLQSLEYGPCLRPDEPAAVDNHGGYNAGWNYSDYYADRSSGASPYGSPTQATQRVNRRCKSIFRGNNYYS